MGVSVGVASYTNGYGGHSSEPLRQASPISWSLWSGREEQGINKMNQGKIKCVRW